MMMMQSRENNTHTHADTDTDTHLELLQQIQIRRKVLGKKKKYINNTNKYALSRHFFTFGFSRFDLFSIVN